MEISKEIIELDKAAHIIAERLGTNILKYKVTDTQALLESIDWKLVGNAIHILYNYYGMFPDMGLYGGLSLSNAGKKKPWYSKMIYSEVLRLSELVAQRLGQRAVNVIGDVTEGNQFAKGTGTKQLFDAIRLEL